MKRKLKILNYLLIKRIEFKVKLPFVFILFFIFFPLAAYADYVIFKNSFQHYFVVCFIEVLLFYAGYIYGINDKINIKKLKKYLEDK